MERIKAPYFRLIITYQLASDRQSDLTFNLTYSIISVMFERLSELDRKVSSIRQKTIGGPVSIDTNKITKSSLYAVAAGGSVLSLLHGGTPSVEAQSNSCNVKVEVKVQAYNDLNGNKRWDPNEPIVGIVSAREILLSTDTDSVLGKTNAQGIVVNQRTNRPVIELAATCDTKDANGKRAAKVTAKNQDNGAKTEFPVTDSSLSNEPVKATWNVDTDAPIAPAVTRVPSGVRVPVVNPAGTMIPFATADQRPLLSSTPTGTPTPNLTGTARVNEGLAEQTAVAKKVATDIAESTAKANSIATAKSAEATANAPTVTPTRTPTETATNTPTITATPDRTASAIAKATFDRKEEIARRDHDIQRFGDAMEDSKAVEEGTGGHLRNRNGLFRTLGDISNSFGSFVSAFWPEIAVVSFLVFLDWRFRWPVMGRIGGLVRRGVTRGRARTRRGRGNPPAGGAPTNPAGGPPNPAGGPTTPVAPRTPGGAPVAPTAPAAPVTPRTPTAPTTPPNPATGPATGPTAGTPRTGP